FFFSSRRRHTRFSRDWSSDVCSSDLLLPSFLYLPSPVEAPEGAFDLPWDASPDCVVGQYARDRGALVPGRLVASAKSWLSHPGRSEERRVGKGGRARVGGWEGGKR